MTFDDFKNGFFEVFRILWKVSLLWNFAGDRIDFDFNRDIGEEDAPGTIRKAIEDILSVF